MHNAFDRGHLEVVKYLLENGTNINDKDSKESTGLAWASENGHLEVAKYLRGRGAKDDVFTRCIRALTKIMPNPWAQGS